MKRIRTPELNIKLGEKPTDYFMLPKALCDENKTYFAFTASGDGMALENIRSGDIVIFEETDKIENGDIGCFRFKDNQIACKKYFYDEENKLHILEFCDLKQKPIIINEKEKFQVLGKLAFVFNRKN